MGTIIVVSIVIITICILIYIYKSNHDKQSYDVISIQSHHSLTINLHRLVYFILYSLNGNPYDIRVVPPDDCIDINPTLDPLPDVKCIVNIDDHQETVLVPVEFFSLICYIIGTSDNPIDPIHASTFATMPHYKNRDAKMMLRLNDEEFQINICGIVLPEEFSRMAFLTRDVQCIFIVTGDHKYMPPILVDGSLRFQQGDLGSCTAVAMCSILHQYTDIVYSPLALYWHARENPYADCGTCLENCINVINGVGMLRENEWPYKPELATLIPPPSTHHPDLEFITIYTVDEAIRILHTGKFIAVETDLPTSSLRNDCAETGIIEDSVGDNDDAGHVVVAVGVCQDGFIVDCGWELFWGFDGRGILPFRLFSLGVYING